ncbi:unnamed protein product [Camellia sinensis]
MPTLIAIKGSRGFKACFQARMFLLQAADGAEQTIYPGATYRGEMPVFGKSTVLHSTCQDSIPGRYESFWKELDYVKQLLKNRQEMKIEDAGIAALFGLECFAWFCAGEIVGRGFKITGYHV